MNICSDLQRSILSNIIGEKFKKMLPCKLNIHFVFTACFEVFRDFGGYVKTKYIVRSLPSVFYRDFENTNQATQKTK
jgi:hypothetical protein